jgi:hypothetical protein
MSKVRNPELIDAHMSAKCQENLTAICFEGVLLPNWARLLFLAEQLCAVGQDEDQWFSRFTSCSGVDDARTVIEQCELLRAGIQEHRESISTELQRSCYSGQSKQILSAWMDSLDTMIRQARTRKTCSWIVEGTEEAEAPLNYLDDGDAALRRI